MHWSSSDAQPRLFPPGTAWEYSGGNYLALGLIVEETTGATLRDELRRRIIEPLGLDGTDMRDRTGVARGYLMPGNPVFPDAGEGLDSVTDLELFGWGSGEMVSTARTSRAFPAGAPRRRAPCARDPSRVVDHSSLRLGGERRLRLGIEEVSSLMGQAPSPCGSAWGHLGFAMGHTTSALSSESGDRQVVVCMNSLVMSDEVWIALGRLVWACYCETNALA